MRGRTLLLTLIVLLVVGGVTRTEAVRLPQALLAPVYDATTQSSLRTLGVALQSYAMFDELTDLTVEELADWGWVPSETAAVTIWVDDDDFRVIAQDVRPGATPFVVTTAADGALRPERLDGAVPAEVAEEPGVTIRTVASL